MGRPSDKLRSARRPGKRERMRVKKKRRGWSSHSLSSRESSVLGADWLTSRYGRKKGGKVMRWLVDLRHPPTPSSGEPVPRYGHIRGVVKLESMRRRGTTELQIGARHTTTTAPERTE